MAAPVETFLESHPDAVAAWYALLARVTGRALSLPLLDRLSHRVRTVAERAGWCTLDATPDVEPPAQADHLTVLSANLWHDWPRRRRWSERLDAVAELVRSQGVDIVLLQEVARTPSLHGDARLARTLGMSRAYARANGSLDAIGFEEGVAVLSRFPIDGLHLRQLGPSRNPLVRRIALGADLLTPLGRVLAVSVHLGLDPRVNPHQVRGLREWVSQLRDDEVAIIGGDFNATEARLEITRTADTWVDTFRGVHPDADGTTHVSGAPWHRWSPGRRLDYVFLQQPTTGHWRVIDAAHLDAPGGPHSDHRAVLARVLPPG